MDFNGGGGIVGLNPSGGFVPTNLVPQNQANLDYVNAVNQASLNQSNLYGPGGFGYQTDQYAAAGAAYGRQTGYYGDPYSATPVSPSSGAGYADRSTLDEAGQAYYDAHVARYGAPPFSDNPGVRAAAPPAPPAPPAPSVQQQAAASDAGSGIGIGVGPRTDPGEGGQVDFNSLNAQQQAYYQAHVAKYGTAPGAGNTTLTGMAGGGGPSGGGAFTQPATPFSPSGPVASDPYSGGGHPTDPGEGAALDPSTWNDGQKAYANAHVLKYGTLPGANNTTMRSLADAPPMQEAPPNSPGGLVGAGGFSPTTTIGGGGGGFTQPTDPGEGAALDPSTWNDAQKAYASAHVLKYGTLPGANNATMTGMATGSGLVSGGGGASASTRETSPLSGIGGGLVGPAASGGASAAMTDPGEGGYVDRSSLNPQQQAYFDAHVARYGTAPGANNTTLSGMSNNVGDFQQEAINQGQQSMHTLLDQVGAALNPTAPSDTLTDADRAIQPTVPATGPGSGVDAINRAAGIDPNTGNEYPPGVDRNTGQPFGVPPPTPGEALPFAYNPQVPFNNPAISQISPSYSSEVSGSPQQQWLAEQRAAIATSIADNPDLLMQIAARIRTEDTNSPEGQQAVFEAMLNNQIATSFDAKGNPVKGVDMLGPDYYPKTGDPATAYQKNLALMQSDPALFSQMKEIMAKVFQGSNVSQGAFGWSQGNSPTAAHDLAGASQTYSSPKTGADFNVFYRPTNADPFGAGTVASINRWLSQMPP